ncbi:flagellar hook-length control protein FliK [Paeniglutamicibacter cryotolerans]|nr:flagellar hook-length control protein FliK [Paeniglutamicibacter cryotolerans]
MVGAGTPDAGTALPATTQQLTGPELDAASPLPAVASQPEESAVQEPTEDAIGTAATTVNPGHVPAGFTATAPARAAMAVHAESPVRPLTAAAVLTAGPGAEQVQGAALTTSSHPVPPLAATAGQPVVALPIPLLVPVEETPAGAAPHGMANASVQLEPATALAPALASAPVRAPQAEPLHRQLAGPLLMLATGPHGERTLSIQVAPEALGPITVKAVIGVEGLRVELTAPGEAGREALRNMLPELRRELASTGAGTVHIGTGPEQGGTGNGPASGGAGHFAPGRQCPGSAAGPQPGSPAQLPEPAAPVTSTTRSSGLDILA